MLAQLTLLQFFTSANTQILHQKRNPRVLHRAFPKRKALALALVAAVREQGASMEDLEWAYEAVHHELEKALRAKAVTEFIDDIETAFKNV